MSGIWESITAFGMTIITTVASSSIIFSQTIPPTSPTPLPSVATVEQSGPVKTINGNYSIAGQNFNYQIMVPTNGGPIIGNFSGSCNGMITGDYKKADNKIDGQAEGLCQIGIIISPIKLTYTGLVDQANNKINLNWQLTKPINQQGSSTVPFN